MSKILILAEHANGQLNQATAKCVTCAKAIGGEVHLAIFSNDGQAVAKQAAGLADVSKVLQIDHQDFSHPLAAQIAPELAAQADGYGYVLAPSTMFGKDVLPRAAALLGVNQVSDIMAVNSARSFKRPVYAGNAIVDVTVPADSLVVATVRTASWAAAGEGGSATIEQSAPQSDRPAHTRFVELRTEAGDRPDLQTANIVISGGRALGSAENFEMIYALARKLKAGVGASRAAVDAGYVPNDMQVGQTGKIISPELYFAFGISGAIQHVTGIKDAGTIIAVNKDADAPIFEIADIGLVGDLFQVIPELEQALS